MDRITYQSIFALSTLKYIKMNSFEFHSSVSLPIATNNQQLSAVKYLVIDHCCTFNEFAVILSYTPEISHLNFLNVYVLMIQLLK
jgi:hypothetical protein